jgi:hypothetical protein
MVVCCMPQGLVTQLGKRMQHAQQTLREASIRGSVYHQAFANPLLDQEEVREVQDLAWPVKVLGLFRALLWPLDRSRHHTSLTHPRETR